MDAAASPVVESGLAPSTPTDFAKDDDSRSSSFVRSQSAPDTTDLLQADGEETDVGPLSRRERATYAGASAAKPSVRGVEHHYFRSRISRLLWGSADNLGAPGGAPCRCFAPVPGLAVAGGLHRRRCRCRTRVASVLWLLLQQQQQSEEQQAQQVVPRNSPAATAGTLPLARNTLPSSSCSRSDGGCQGQEGVGESLRRLHSHSSTPSYALEGACEFCSVRPFCQRSSSALRPQDCKHLHCRQCHNQASHYAIGGAEENGELGALLPYKPPVKFCVCPSPTVPFLPEACRAVASPQIFFEPYKPGRRVQKAAAHQPAQPDRSDSDEEKPRPLQISDDGILVDSNLAAERRRKLRASGDTSFSQTASSAIMLADSISREMRVRLEPYEPQYAVPAPVRPSHRGCSNITGNVSATHLAAKFEEEQKRDPSLSLRCEALLTAFSFFWRWQHYTRALSRAKRVSEANIVGIALKQMPISVIHVKWCLRLLLFSRKYGLYTWNERRAADDEGPASPSSACLSEITNDTPVNGSPGAAAQQQQRFTVPVLSQTGQFHYYLPSLAALRRSSVSGNVIKEYVSLTASLFSLPMEDLKLLLGSLAHALVEQKASCGDDQRSLYSAVLPLSCNCCLPPCRPTGVAVTNLPSEKAGMSGDPLQPPPSAADPSALQLPNADSGSSPPESLLCSHCGGIVLFDVLRAHCCCCRQSRAATSLADGGLKTLRNDDDSTSVSAKQTCGSLSVFPAPQTDFVASPPQLPASITQLTPAVANRGVVLSLIPDVVEFAAVDPPSYLKCSSATSVRLARRLYEWRSAVSLLGRQLHRSIVQMNGVVSDGPIPRYDDHRSDGYSGNYRNSSSSSEDSELQTWDQLD